MSENIQSLFTVNFEKHFKTKMKMKNGCVNPFTRGLSLQFRQKLKDISKCRMSTEVGDKVPKIICLFFI